MARAVRGGGCVVAQRLTAHTKFTQKSPPQVDMGDGVLQESELRKLLGRLH